jgi:hypothetical protein
MVSAKKCLRMNLRLQRAKLHCGSGSTATIPHLNKTRGEVRARSVSHSGPLSWKPPAKPVDDYQDSLFEIINLPEPAINN